MTAHWWKKDQYLQQVYMHWQMKEHDCSIKTMNLSELYITVLGTASSNKYHYCPTKQTCLKAHEVMMKYYSSTTLLSWTKEADTHLSTLFFQWSVVEQLFNQIHMREQHSSAAIPLQSKGIQCITGNNNGHFARLHCTINSNIKTVNLKPQRSWP